MLLKEEQRGESARSTVRDIVQLQRVGRCLIGTGAPNGLSAGNAPPSPGIQSTGQRTGPAPYGRGTRKFPLSRSVDAETDGSAVST